MLEVFGTTCRQKKGPVIGGRLGLKAVFAIGGHLIYHPDGDCSNLATVPTPMLIWRAIAARECPSSPKPQRVRPQHWRD